MPGASPATTTRPVVSVIVPFLGPPADLDRLLAALERLELDHHDEVIVADNRPGCADARLFAVHPQTRAILHRRLFWNVWHFLLLRSALALLAPGWLRRLVLTRHALSLRERGRRAGAGSWSVPFLLLYDAIETAAILHGAIRHRTVVL